MLKSFGDHFDKVAFCAFFYGGDTSTHPEFPAIGKLQQRHLARRRTV